jgi:hypothetical protein
MSELWYYTQDGKPMPPIGGAELQRLARDGLLKPTDMVWRDGMPAWIRADAAPGVFAGARLVGDEAMVALRPSPLPGAPANESATPLERPILLEPIRRAERQNPGKEPAGARRRRWDGKGEPDIAMRRPRRDRHQQMLVLWIGLLAGGGLLLVVLVLGLFYMMMTAL